MKKFIVVVFFLFFPCCINAYSDETTVSGLELNKSSYSDIEVYMDSLNKIYIPVKQTAKILKIPFKENSYFKIFQIENDMKKSDVVSFFV